MQRAWGEWNSRHFRSRTRLGCCCKKFIFTLIVAHAGKQSKHPCKLLSYTEYPRMPIMTLKFKWSIFFFFFLWKQTPGTTCSLSLSLQMDLVHTHQPGKGHPFRPYCMVGARDMEVILGTKIQVYQQSLPILRYLYVFFYLKTGWLWRRIRCPLI